MSLLNRIVVLEAETKFLAAILSCVAQASGLTKKEFLAAAARAQEMMEEVEEDEKKLKAAMENLGDQLDEIIRSQREG